MIGHTQTDQSYLETHDTHHTEILRHFTLQLILMTQPHGIFIYYVNSSFMVSTKKKVHVLDLHNLVIINTSLSVSVLTLCINFKNYKCTFSKK